MDKVEINIPLLRAIHIRNYGTCTVNTSRIPVTTHALQSPGTYAPIKK